MVDYILTEADYEDISKSITRIEKAIEELQDWFRMILADEDPLASLEKID